MSEQKPELWQVVVIYTSVHGGTWYGPPEPLEAAQKRLTLERSRVQGSAHLERAYV